MKNSYDEKKEGKIGFENIVKSLYVNLKTKKFVFFPSCVFLLFTICKIIKKKMATIKVVGSKNIRPIK